MGFNTVVFLLNDNMHLIPQSPKSVAELISTPDVGYASRARNDAEYRRSIAEFHKEPIVGEQTVEVLPTFHADETKFFRAGGNCIVELRVVKHGTHTNHAGKKVRTVTLELPEWDK